MCKALIDNEASTECATERPLLQKGENEAVLPLHLLNLPLALWLQGRLEHGPGKYQQYSY